MSNHVHNRLTVVKGNAEEVLKFISEQEGVLDPSIYKTELKLNLNFTEKEAERVNITNASTSVGFDTKWVPLKEEQVQALLEKFPEYEIIYHFSEEMGNFSDQEYHFLNGKQVEYIEFPNWRDEAEATAAKEKTLEGIFSSNGSGFQVDGVVAEISESAFSTRIYTDAFEPDSHGHVLTVFLTPNKVKQLGVKQGDAVCLIFDTKFETAVVCKDRHCAQSESVTGSVASQFATTLQTIPSAPSKFNPKGPGAFGYNRCARCGTDVDINGLDRDNRKHFEAAGGCAGFAKADLERIKARFSKQEKENLRRVLFVTEDREYARNAMLSTIENEDVREEYEDVNKALLLWEPKKREAEQKIDQATKQFIRAIKEQLEQKIIF